MYLQSSHSRRSHILFVHRSNEYGGAEKHLIDLIQSFPESENRFSILCLEVDFFTERLHRNKMAYVDIKCIRGLRSFWRWLRVLRAFRADAVVFVNGVLWTFPWYTSVAGWLSGIPRRFSIAHLPPPPAPAKISGWSMHCLARRFRRIRHLLGLRLSASFYTATICVSNAIRDSLLTNYRFPTSKTITIHNGVSLSMFDRHTTIRAAVRVRERIGSDEFLLVCVARLSEQKGIDILLSAMARLLRDGVRCKCIIVGDGPLRHQLSDQALVLGLSGHVFFEGFQEDVRPYLQEANAFVLTSHKEGLPLAILEAMALGLPCVVTNVGGNSEVVTHGIHGLVVSPGSVDEVASAISYLVTHPQECIRMARMAQTTIREKFNIEEQMAEIRHAILARTSFSRALS